jgi:hypothetical protein
MVEKTIEATEHQNITTLKKKVSILKSKKLWSGEHRLRDGRRQKADRATDIFS